VLTVVLATSTAALFGGADFLGGFASRRDSAFVVTASAHVLGVFIAWSRRVRSCPTSLVTTPDLAFGAVAGISGGLGVVALYAGLAAGRMSVVAPITAAIAGSVPAVYDVATGGTVSLVGGGGLILALAAIVLVSTATHPDDLHGMSRRALLLALGAGFGFAGSFISFSLTGAESGLWPVVSARVISAVLLGSIAWMRYRRLFASYGVRRVTAGVGILDAAANVTMIAAIRLGPLAVASVLGSLYPVTTVLLAFFLLKERVVGMQRVGVLIAFVAILATAFAGVEHAL
jgi:drug/metabolite transporter (DMT)-like permease